MTDPEYIKPPYPPQSDREQERAAAGLHSNFSAPRQMTPTNDLRDALIEAIEGAGIMLGTDETPSSIHSCAEDLADVVIKTVKRWIANEPESPI